MTEGKLKFAQISRGVNLNWLKLQGGKPKFSQITGGVKFSMKVQNKKIFKLQG